MTDSPQSAHFPVRAEDRLVVHCLRKFLGTARESLAQPCASVDWEAFLARVSCHRLFSVAHRGIADIEGVPERISASLRERHFRNAARQILLGRELVAVLEFLREKGIDAVPYKGPAMAVQIYGDAAVRTCDDLDILVPPSRVLSASELLATRGYLLRAPLGTKQQRALIASEHAMDLVHGKTKIALDLHWKIAESFFGFGFDLGEARGRFEAVRLEGREILTLGREDLLLILCAHNAKHLWQRLSWFADVARLIQIRPELDWDSILRQAAGLRMRRILRLGLLLVAEIAGVRIPGRILAEARRDSAVTRLAAQANGWLGGNPPDGAGAGERLLFQIRARESAGDRMIYCLKRSMTLNPRDYSILRLPLSLFPAYLLLRPIRLLLKFLRGGFGRMARCGEWGGKA